MNEIICIIKKFVPNVGEWFSTDELRQIYSENKSDFAKQESPHAVVNLFKEIIHEWRGNEYRICSECGNIMRDGYCVNAGDRYYCSDECLGKHFTPHEWLQECEENDQSYYTE